MVLDVAQDRYRMFGVRAAAAIQLLADDDICRDTEILGALVRASVLEPEGKPVRLPTIAPVAASALEWRDDIAIPQSVAALGWEMAVMAWRLRALGLRRTLDHAAHYAVQASPVPEGRLVGLAQGISRVRRQLPVTPLCLRDSLAIFVRLGRAGIRTSLVIGVRLDPFAAHCWVQLGDLLLTDRVDMVSGYSPILVL